MTDYKDHLKDYKGRVIGANFYKKAINYFRNMYENPQFLVISDDKNTAFELVVNPQKNQNDVHFVGTVDLGLQGLLTKENTTGIDFAILTLCDHIIGMFFKS